jgi:hypothetical protein
VKKCATSEKSQAVNWKNVPSHLWVWLEKQHSRANPLDHSAVSGERMCHIKKEPSSKLKECAQPPVGVAGKNTKKAVVIRAVSD